MLIGRQEKERIVLKIAYISAPGRGDMDLILQGLADRLLARGARVAGVVQTNTDCGPDKPCDMDVKVLPKGPKLRISQTLGRGSRGCRLDVSVLEEAAGHVATSLEAGPDLLLINKFGKQEADGRGFRPVIADAILREIPVIVGVNGLNRERFEQFTGGIAKALPADVDALETWFRSAD